MKDCFREEKKTVAVYHLPKSQNILLQNIVR